MFELRFLSLYVRVCIHVPVELYIKRHKKTLHFLQSLTLFEMVLTVNNELQLRHYNFTLSKLLDDVV